jgi:hypothetical protein
LTFLKIMDCSFHFKNLYYFKELSKSVSFEVLMVVNVKIIVFWDVTRCSLVDRYQRFTQTYCLHLQDRNTERAGSSEIFIPPYQHIQWAHPKDHTPNFKSVCPLPAIINDMIFTEKRHCLLTLRVHAPTHYTTK